MHGKQLGLLQPADPETSPSAAQGTVVTLGKGLTAYVLRADHGTAVAIVEELMQKVEKAQLHWPAGSGSVGLISFADGLVSLVREIRSRTPGAECGFTGGGDATQHCYNVKHIVRVMLFEAERRHGPEIFDGLSMADVARWTPDENGHLQHVAHLSCGDARNQFGMSPFLLSCLFCFVHPLSEGDKRLLMRADAKRLLAPVLKWEAALENTGTPLEDAFSPTPASLLQSLRRTVASGAAADGGAASVAAACQTRARGASARQTAASGAAARGPAGTKTRVRGASAAASGATANGAAASGAAASGAAASARGSRSARKTPGPPPNTETAQVVAKRRARQGSPQKRRLRAR